MSKPIKSETYISDLSLNGPITNTLDDDMNGKKKRIEYYCSRTITCHTSIRLCLCILFFVFLSLVWYLDFLYKLTCSSMTIYDCL